jgi:hypothetical protein
MSAMMLRVAGSISATLSFSSTATATMRPSGETLTPSGDFPSATEATTSAFATSTILSELLGPSLT